MFTCVPHVSLALRESNPPWYPNALSMFAIVRDVETAAYAAVERGMRAAATAQGYRAIRVSDSIQADIV